MSFLVVSVCGSLRWSKTNLKLFFLDIFLRETFVCDIAAGAKSARERENSQLLRQLLGTKLQSRRTRTCGEKKNWGSARKNEKSPGISKTVPFFCI